MASDPVDIPTTSVRAIIIYVFLAIILVTSIGAQFVTAKEAKTYALEVTKAILTMIPVVIKQ